MKLNDTQLSQVDAQIKRLVKTDSYYGKKYRELGITGQVRRHLRSFRFQARMT